MAIIIGFALGQLLGTIAFHWCSDTLAPWWKRRQQRRKMRKYNRHLCAFDDK